MTDIEIAQAHEMKKIVDVAAKAGIDEKHLELYGNYKAKLDLSEIRKLPRKAKLILVTAISPTPAGEGKTTTSVGLADALNKLGKNTMVCLREPSLGPVFGVKGGAAGGGYAQVVPMEDINLHFTGDFHAIGAANNLLAAMLDNHIQQGNVLGIDPRKIVWKRAVDMNDRQLRHIIDGLGGKASGVPAERVGEAERVRLDQLEARLAAQVIGQPRAVHAVAAAIRRSRTGLRENGRPIGAMLFLGPTGVGKTQLARTLAKCWFGSEKSLLRFDMSEYMEKHTVARLLGAPPGYVGHEEGGQLTEAVRRRPYSVVLFDEIEKAHSDIQNILLQILEDGTLTDAQGRKADFSNTIILLTSNLGARCLAGQASPLGFGAAAEETARRGKKALQEAKDYFRPELMGRLDDVVLFDPLGPAQLAAIADRLLCELEERAARQGYTLRHTPAAAAALAGDTVPAYGARELRRKVSRAVEQALADRIAAGTARPGVLFVADAAPDGHITLTMGDVAACAS